MLFAIFAAGLLPPPPSRRTTQLPLQSTGAAFTPSSKYWCGVCTTGT